MNLQLKLSEGPYVLDVSNEEGNTVRMDASPAIGGLGKGMRPMDLLASSLAGCMSIDVLSILRKQRQNVTKFEIAIITSRKNAIPSPFEEIQLIFRINSAVSLEKLKHAVELSHQKYCSVSASLSKEIQITTHIQHID